MKRPSFIFLLSVLSIQYAQAQIYGKHGIGGPVTDTIITAFDDNNDSTVYTAMQRIISGIQPISYVSPLLLHFRPKDRVVPLRFGEGKNGYTLEAWADQTFTLLQGRSQMDHFSQTSRVSFRYAPAVRMTMDNSSNLLPGNHKAGIQVDKILWDSYTRLFFTDRPDERFAFADDNSWLRQKHTLHLLHATFNAMHYSNGQGEGVYASVEDSIIGRNDYVKGDFSTNLLNLTLTYSYYNTFLMSAGFGYQHDGNWGGPFSYIEEQRKRYGNDRLLGFLQYRSPPVQNKFRKSITVRDIYHQRSFEVKRLWEHRVRVDLEYILGPLDRFKRVNNSRLNTHIFYELNPLRSRTAGIIAHVYHGRDYMNIRYDDIVFVFMAGISFTLNKYRHPRFNPNNYIIREISEAKFEKIRNAGKVRQLKY
ncbi:MAG: hypothetical protein WKF97_01880 [Chitinophagaceae bacterium]